MGWKIGDSNFTYRVPKLKTSRKINCLAKGFYEKHIKDAKWMFYYCLTFINKGYLQVSVIYAVRKYQLSIFFM